MYTKAIKVILLLTVTAATQVQAHGIWFAQRATQTGLIYGVGADDLDMVKRLPLITDFAAYDENLTEVEAELAVAGPVVLVVSDWQPTVMTAELNNGIWSKTADGRWHKKGLDEVPDAVIAERTMKYAVHVKSKLNKPLGNLPGQKAQIIPVGGFLPEMKGDILQVQVLLNGNPVTGAAIKEDFVNDPDQTPILTDKNGMATIGIRNQGLNVVAAIIDGPSDDPAKVRKVEYLATLSFVLEHLPE